MQFLYASCLALACLLSVVGFAAFLSDAIAHHKATRATRAFKRRMRSRRPSLRTLAAANPSISPLRILVNRPYYHRAYIAARYQAALARNAATLQTIAPHAANNTQAAASPSISA